MIGVLTLQQPAVTTSQATLFQQPAAVVQPETVCLSQTGINAGGILDYESSLEYGDFESPEVKSGSRCGQCTIRSGLKGVLTTSGNCESCPDLVNKTVNP